MISIDLNHPLCDLDGNPVPDTNAGKLLATQLVSTPHGNIVKHMDWALTLNRGQALQGVDNADLDYLKKFVENHANFSILAKHQILKMMNQPTTKEP